MGAAIPVMAGGLSTSVRAVTNGESPAWPEESGERSLSLISLHTGESLDCTYWRDGKYLKSELGKLNVLLRDFRADKIAQIDTQVIDFLNVLSLAAMAVQGDTGPVQILSGYRTPETNAMLRSRSRGVASRSLHMSGRAIDFRIPSVDTRFLRDQALRTQLGGVGLYSRADFLHIDSGRVRTWGS